MKYSVVMRDNNTGEVKTIPQGDIEWHGDGSIFWWTEGNFGCDCNRSLEWFRHSAETEPEARCGQTRFTVIKAILENGDEIGIDMPL